MSTSRREFLTSAASGLVLPAAAVLAPTLLLPRKASAQNGGIPTALYANAMNSATVISRTAAGGTGGIYAEHFSTHCDSASALFGYLSASGITAQLARIFAATAAADPTTVANAAAWMGNGTNAVKIGIDPGMYTWGVPVPPLQRVLNQLSGDLKNLQYDVWTPLVRVTNQMYAGGLIAYRHSRNRMDAHLRPIQNGGTIINPNDAGDLIAAGSGAAVVGGVLVAAGLGAGGVLGTGVAAGVTGFVLVTGGVGLAVIGAAAIAYGVYLLIQRDSGRNPHLQPKLQSQTGPFPAMVMA